jgi:hypothetical protein
LGRPVAPGALERRDFGEFRLSEVGAHCRGVINRTILDLARAQHGLLSRRQLIDLDVSSSRIHRMANSGLLVDVLPTVWLVAPSPDTHDMRCRALTLWCDGVGFLSGQTAGRLHGLTRMRTSPVEYTVPHGFKRTAPGWASLRQTSWYGGDDDRIDLESGLTVAHPYRMLFGLAADSWTQRWFDNAADEAWNLGLIEPCRLGEYLERHRCRGKDGVARIDDWVERAVHRERPAQSHLERDLIHALVNAGLPTPVRQHRLCLPPDDVVIHLDIAWPDIRLAIEPGHSLFHRGETAAERDTLRDLGCSQLGWSIHRLTEGIRTDLPHFARMIRSIHRQRSRDIPLERRGTVSILP